MLGGLVGCGLGRGTVPLAFGGSDQPDFKMLRPGVTARACGATVWPFGGRADDGLLQTALADLLDQSGAADVVRDLRVSWRGVDLLIARIGCVTAVGDVGRVISTVKLPMLGDHGDHGHHGETAP
jgi:hypothetical protein